MKCLRLFVGWRGLLPAPIALPWIVTGALVLGGCGQSGPLVLPRPPAKPPDTVPAKPVRTTETDKVIRPGADTTTAPGTGPAKSP